MSSSAVQKSLVVFGGNGFLGRRICQQGIQKGYKITSMSRSGAPPKNILPSDNQWVEKVNWKKVNIFDPETYADELATSNIVVHSLGILLEGRNYKETLNSFPGSKNSSVFCKNGVSSISPYPNPMDKSIYNSYDYMNRQSALIACREFLEKTDPFSKRTFVYISADQNFVGIPHGYLDSKRKAESEILQMKQNFENFQPILMRPSFMFDETISNDFRVILKDGLSLLNYVNKNLLNDTLSSFVRPPVSTQKVARCIFDKIEEEKFDGPVLLEEILKH
ncbi:hypothetical protein PACTADRAFT_48073 [Pachysolen tannophilus NRRL Y-2460]|uniref:NAD-dependent epimerase/dehydratase domain-containing protein n=1 Tax=Pachysolen tannophilus NRRL Y-2460 TaxID=669874 RepID=A0A1E4U2Q1_PACTA|nr:hypothetical protein PACTADRAFT_48073 [Pachysolen tannophilus NRRL Y-2460]